MSRNNEERIGTKNIDAPMPPPEALASTETAPLSFTVPTQFVELPSKGRYYPEGHPLYGKESLEIRFMTAKDEDILTSRTLLKQGIAIDRLLINLIVDKTINIDDLLVGDKNALIIGARITGYGEDYDTNVGCPVCGTSSKNHFDLSDSKVNCGGAGPTEGQATETSSGTFLITLPKSNVEVEVRLMTGTDEKKLAQLAEQKKKHNLGDSGLTDQLRMIIIAVNGDNNIGSTTSFIENMPALDSRHLRSIYTKLNPNIEMEQTFSCNSCGYRGEMEVPFTADFFWPR